MKKYTFDDWLNNRITEKSPFPDTLGGKDYPPMPINILYNQKKITKTTFAKITRYQKEAFILALDMNYEAKKEIFTKRYENAQYKDDFINSEIIKTNIIINRDQNILNHVLAGEYEYRSITGKQYLEIVSDHGKTKKGKYSWSYTGFNDSIIIASAYKYLKFLENEKETITGKINKHKIKPSYENYFRNPDYIKTFEKALQDSNHLINGKFNKKGDNEVIEINVITLILYHKNYLNRDVKKSHRIFFGKRFGLSYIEKTYRTSGNEYQEDISPHKKIYDHYFNIIPTLN